MASRPVLWRDCSKRRSWLGMREKKKISDPSPQRNGIKKQLDVRHRAFTFPPRIPLSLLVSADGIIGPIPPLFGLVWSGPWRHVFSPTCRRASSRESAARSELLRSTEGSSGHTDTHHPTPTITMVTICRSRWPGIHR